jgi:hypothetical protein
MSFHLNHEQSDKGNWRRRGILRTEDLAREFYPSGWRLEGADSSREWLAVRPIKKDCVVMSQWVHYSWNLEGPEAAPA